MWGNQQNFNNFNRGGIMPQQSFGAPIQQIQDVQKTAQFYSVNNPQEMDAIRPDLNVIYIGLNKTKKEIYVKQMALDGTILSEVYNLASNEQKRDDLNVVLEKLANIEKRLSDNERNFADVNKQVNGGAVTTKSAYESI